MDILKTVYSKRHILASYQPYRGMYFKYTGFFAQKTLEGGEAKLSEICTLNCRRYHKTAAANERGGIAHTILRLT